MSYVELDEGTFENEVLKEANTPVLVDFWAPWCGPCMMLTPIIDDLADELDGEVKICKVNCDENAEIAMSMGVSSIPCLVLFSGGEEKNRLVGLNSKQQIIDFINNNK